MQSLVGFARCCTTANSTTLLRQAKPIWAIQIQLGANVEPRHSPLLVQAAAMSFYKNPPQSELWKMMTGVSAQGKKRGRAKKLMRPKNLNRGQIIGFGRRRMDFPGLTSPVTHRGTGNVTKNKIAEMNPLTYDRYEENLKQIRENSVMFGRRKKERNPLERGWSGARQIGKRYGAPVAVNEELKFHNFDSVLLEFKMVVHMTGVMGRVRRTSALMVTGNKNGTFGYSLTAGKFGNNRNTFATAVNKAGLRLFNIDRYEDRTVFHDFFTQYRNTSIFVEQRPPGTGIIAQRGIKAICEMAGIKDLYAKIEGSNNIQCITKAFILGLLRQKSHQTMADEKGLHLVQMKKENDYFPQVLASPSNGKVRTQEEIGHNEILDFQMISFEGHLPAPRHARRNDFEGSMGWDKHLRRFWAREAHPRVRQHMWIQNGFTYGAVKSHLNDKYPECNEINMKVNKQEAENADT